MNKFLWIFFNFNHIKGIKLNHKKCCAYILHQSIREKSITFVVPKNDKHLIKASILKFKNIEMSLVIRSHPVFVLKKININP